MSHNAYFLPLRDAVVFPSMVIPLFIGRDQSVASLLEAIEHDEDICLVTQKDENKTLPKSRDLYRVGVLARILQVFRMPDRTMKILVEGHTRVKCQSFNMAGRIYTCEYDFLDVPKVEYEKGRSLIKILNKHFQQFGKMTDHITQDVWSSLKAVTDPSVYVDLVSVHLPISTLEKQQILEQGDVEKRLEHVLYLLKQELDWLKVDKRLQDKVRDQIAEDQRSYFRREKLKAIQDELEDESFGEEGKNEIQLMEDKINELKADKDLKDKLSMELNRYRKMQPMSSEAALIKNYLDTVLELPWGKRKKCYSNISKAEKTLNSHHDGLNKVKERILEALAVQARVKKFKGPILCLVGPPGVGKTSLGQSVAEACGRPFVRISLGGLRDEAEVRGHRRTYIGAMPGRIIKAMKKAGYANPLILLDEIDKVGSDFRGDPSAALLEVLDPEQNKSFSDHYLEFDYDLSDVLFMTTANTLNVSPALLDRMEILQLSGYTQKEKVAIANNHLIPKVMAENGVKSKEMTIEEPVVNTIIQYYTREAGVRQLERALAKVCRYSVRHNLCNAENVYHVKKKDLARIMGKQQYVDEIVLKEAQVGEVHGLAWTSVGGEVLTIEAVAIPGTGLMKHTGKLGDVMKESMETAFTIVKAHNSQLASDGYFKENDFHIHVPDGATPKDGPSAGIAITTALMSLVTDKPVPHNSAMTGEVTLRGQILAVGGIKEKLLAAHRMGIKKIFLPSANKKDMEDIPKEVKRELKTVWLNNVCELFNEFWH